MLILIVCILYLVNSKWFVKKVRSIIWLYSKCICYFSCFFWNRFDVFEYPMDFSFFYIMSFSLHLIHPHKYIHIYACILYVHSRSSFLFSLPLSCFWLNLQLRSLLSLVIQLLTFSKARIPTNSTNIFIYLFTSLFLLM